MVKEKYSEMKEEDVIRLAVENDKEAIEYVLRKYKGIVLVKARTYFIIGADKEDIIQEGMIGLCKAIRSYQPQREVTFRTFAELCITRQMISAIKSATRQKHIPMNSYLSLYKPVFEEETGRDYMELLTEGTVSDPEELFIDKENTKFIEKNIVELLSNLEREILEEYLLGKNYSEIATSVNKPEKSIDNALQRVKRKLEKFLKEKNCNIGI